MCAAGMSAILCGCGVGSSADSLLSAPMISEEQKAVYEALQSSVGDDFSLVYPKGGAYRSAFVFYDLDGDGSDEAAAFYQNNSDAEGGVRVNILDNADGRWASVYDHAGTGTSVEQVIFTDLGGVGKTRMIIGYSHMAPSEKTLRVYSFSDGILEHEYSESYYKLMSIDLDRDGGEDIALINANTDEHQAYISLVTDRGNGVDSVSSVMLNEHFADIPSVIGGRIANDTPALFIDGVMGSGNLSTEIIYCVNGELRNPAGLDNSKISSLTARSSGLYCRDVDGDGIVEIPSREPFPGYREANDMQYLTNWNVFENYTIVKKYSSLTEAAKGYSFMLPVRWEGLVTVKNDAATGEKVFYKYNTSLRESRLELMRVLVCPQSKVAEKSMEGYFTALTGENAVYMVKFGDTEDNLLLTVAEVSNNFYLY